jgi:hypothetical protein
MRNRFTAFAALAILAVLGGGFIAIQSPPAEEVSEWRATREQREVLSSLGAAQTQFHAAHGRLAKDRDELARIQDVEVPVCVNLEWSISDDGQRIDARTVHPKASVTCSLRIYEGEAGSPKCLR